VTMPVRHRFAHLACSLRRRAIGVWPVTEQSTHSHMKFPLPLLVVTSTILAVATAQTESSSAPSADAARGEVTRLTVDAIERQVTVSDLMGKTVVDQNQERIGVLHDIDLSGLFSTEHSDQAGGAAIAWVIGSGENDDAGYVSIEAGRVQFDQSQGQVTIRLPAAGDQRAVSATGRSGETATSEDDALAPVEVAIADPANTIEPVAVAAVPGSEMEVATTGSDVLQVEQALAQHENTRDVADRIGVMSSTDAILLTGEIASDEKREQVLQVAREATHREVRDLMQVAAAE
jgi:hypothetical protein